jgi:hypothetical protein
MVFLSLSESKPFAHTLHINHKLLSFFQIKIWFQNRRAKERRDSRKGKYTEHKGNSSVEEDDKAHEHSHSSLDNANEFFTSCCLTGSEKRIEEGRFNTGQCRFSKQTESHGICANGTTSSRSCLFESRDERCIKPSVSPTEWRVPTGNSFMPIENVSPLIGMVNIDKELRL